MDITDDHAAVVGAAGRAAAGPAARRCSPTDPGPSRALPAAGRRPAHRLLQEPDRRRVDASTLLAVAAAAGVEARRDAMFAGEKINVTEQRAVLHTALRAAGDAVVSVDGHDVVPDVHEVLGADGRVRRPGAQRRVASARPASGSPPSSTSASAAATSARRWPTWPPRRSASTACVPLRQQRRRRRHRRQPRRPRPGDDARRRQLEDVHHRRDDHQRHARRAAG